MRSSRATSQASRLFCFKHGQNEMYQACIIVASTCTGNTHNYCFYLERTYIHSFLFCPSLSKPYVSQQVSRECVCVHTWEEEDRLTACLNVGFMYTDQLPFGRNPSFDRGARKKLRVLIELLQPLYTQRLPVTYFNISSSINR